MKVLVVSDSHGSIEEIESIKKEYEGKVDAIFHCGDSELEFDHPIMKTFLTVRGNCDFDSRYPNDRLEEIDGHRIFMTHGHLYNVKMSLLNLQYKAKEHNANIVFFGHSHVLGAEMIDGTLFLNPGSILLPRGHKEQSYAIVETNNATIDVAFYNDQHKKLTDRDVQFPFAK